MMNIFQKRYLLNNYKTKSDNELARKLGVDKREVRKTLKKMGIFRKEEEAERIRNKQVSPEGVVSSIEKRSKLPYLFFVFLIVALGISAYFTSFSNGFVWDDVHLIVKNNYLGDIKNAFVAFGKDYYFVVGEGKFYRPILALSFMLDYHFWKLNPLGFHITSTIWHIINGLLVFLLIMKLSKNRIISFMAAALFVVHPVQTEAVTYISGRADPISTAFSLTSLLLFISSFSPGRAKGLIFYALSLLCFMVSILAKEMAIIFPVILFFYESTFVPKIARGSTVNRTLRYVPFIVILLLYAYFRLNILGFASGMAMTAKGALYTRLLTAAKVYVLYIGLFLMPVGLHMERFVPKSMTLLDPHTFLSVIVIILLVSSIFIMRKSFKLYYFGLGWFLLALIPQSDIIPINAQMAEHWLYVPSIGFFLAVSALACRFARLMPQGRRKMAVFLRLIPAGVLIIVLGIFTSLTIKRNADWKDSLTLYKATLRDNPLSYRVQSNLGNYYVRKGMFDEAIKRYKKALELNDNFADAHNNIAVAYRNKGMLKEAKEHWKRAIELGSRSANPFNNLGEIYLKEGRYGEAIHFFRKAIELNPTRKDIYRNLVTAYMKKGMPKEAEKYRNFAK